MQKSRQTISCIPPRGKKKSFAIRLLFLLAISIALPLAVLHDGKTPVSKATASAAVTVDFGSRQNKAHPIPSTFLGVGGIGLLTAANYDGNSILQANFHLTKLGDYDYMSLIFPTKASMTDASQQSWAKFDTEMSLALLYHLRPIITLAYTPGWLQPQNQSPPRTNPCLTYNPPQSAHSVEPMFIVNGKDQGPQVWGNLSAQFVAHVDHLFPQAHAMYEIWNQPDGAQFLCMPQGDPNSDQDRFTAYKAIFAAAAPQMKAQAKKDGVQIQIGGPALVYALQGHLKLWLPNLLNDPSTYPYIDFISYHRYLSSSTFSSGSASMVTNAQDPIMGVAAQYEQVARIVHAGKQPNAAQTPIYVDEYSINPCHPNHCTNHPIYAPLGNALFLTDFLNSVNDTHSPFGAAPSLPAGLAYYSWNIPLEYLCMYGVLDALMDCSIKNGVVQPYPQYFTYQLFGGANYLDITNGGYVANAASTNQTGVFVTGFYTKTLDSMVITNTTATDYPAFNLLAQNPGKVPGSQASFYIISFNKSNPSQSITTQQVSLSQGANGNTATIHLPAYTTVALSFPAQ